MPSTDRFLSVLLSTVGRCLSSVTEVSGDLNTHRPLAFKYGIFVLRVTGLLCVGTCFVRERGHTVNNFFFFFLLTLCERVLLLTVDSFVLYMQASLLTLNQRFFFLLRGTVV